MNTRTLGKNGPAVSAIGLGCMGMSEFYGTTDDAESIRVIHRALDCGITMLDTADMYGFGHNERLIGKALASRSGDVFLATKCGIVRKQGEYRRTISNSPEYIRSSVEASLKRLGRSHIDLYYLHRIDAATPLEDSIGELSRLVDEGKIRHIGLSEVSPGTIEKAEKIHHITAIQSEYSLFTREAEERLLPTLSRLGIGFVPYSPMGRGLLSGKLEKKDIAQENDLRRVLPRTGENFDANMQLVKQLGDIASTVKISPAQAALSWVLSKSETIVPIPGTKREKYLLENAAAADIILDDGILRRLEELFVPGSAQGERYTQEGMKGIE